MIELEERREALESEIQDISSQLATLQKNLTGADVSTASKAPAKRGRKAGERKATGRAPRGSVRESMLKELGKAGSEGATAKDLASALGTKPANIYAWFNTTGRRESGIKKRDGRYFLTSSAAAEPSPAAAPAAAKPARGRKPGGAKGPKKTRQRKPKAAKAAAGGARGRRKGAGRGELMASILDALKQAGSKGITVKELSDKLGVPYKNIYIWFVTTGKKNPSIKRVGPAQYKLES